MLRRPPGPMPPSASLREKSVRPRLEWLESRVLPALDLLSTTGAFLPSQLVPAPPPLAQPQAEVQATLPDAQPSLWYRLEVTAPALLRANLSALEGVGLRLALTGSTGSLLVTSEGLIGDPTGAAIVQHVEAGTYFLGVSADEAARFHLVTHLSSATSPTQPLPMGAHPRAVREADLNGDGRLDLLTANETARSLSVLLGNGDGTFQPRRDIPLSAAPRALLMQDLDGDFRPDVLVATSTGLLLLTGDGAGGFTSPRLLPFAGVPGEMALGDLTGDGRPDLVVTDVGTPTLAGSTLALLEGDGHGGFVPLRTLPVGRLPAGLALADVTGDGRLDVLCSTASFAQLRIFPGDGRGGFGTRRTVPVGNAPASLLTLDLDGNGSLDLVSADAGDDTLTVLFAEGSAFRPLKIPTGAAPSALAAGDLNADGRPDLVTACAGESLQVFLNLPGGFALRGAYPVGSAPAEVRLADLQGDGLLDLVCVNAAGDELFVLLGNGDGTFLAAPRFLVGPDPFSVALADVNLDGRLDVLTADGRDSRISVRLGNGDGTFLARASLPTGERPVAVAASDLNNDGRPDLVTANRSAGTLSVLLGLGDGTFLPATDYRVGLDPQAVLVADVTGDGLLDLVSANSRSGSITLWQGLGNGLFRDALQVPVAAGPFALAVADINRDGRLDLACAGESDGLVTLLLQGGPGRGFTRMDLPVGPNPVSLALADLDHHGWLDILSSRRGGGITLLHGDASGTFVRQADLPTSSTAFALATADVDADGRPDLLSAGFAEGSLALRRGLGEGRFSPPEYSPLGEGPIALAVGDLNRDGRPDLVTANALDASVSALLGTAERFVERSPQDEVPLRHTPHLADLDGDGWTDSLVLDRAGQIYFRPGLPGQQAFGSARILNPAHPARDIVPVATGSGWALAAIDLDPSSPTVYPVSLYRLGPAGVTRSVALTLPRPASRILAGSLDASGRDALVLAHALDGQVSIALPAARPGEFTTPMTRQTGSVPADLALADLRGDGLPEILVPDAGGSGLTVVRNDPGLPLGGLARFRATPGLSGLDASGAVASLYQASSIAVGDFLPGGGPDAAVFLQGSNEIVVLEHNGRGGFLNPDPARISPADTGRQAGQAAGPLLAADVNGDGLLDLALLRRDLGEVWIFLGQGTGRFTRHSVATVGQEAGGLTPWRNSNTGQIDLLVGNSFGDLLRLIGMGDGTFVLPGPPRGNRVTLALLDGPSVLVANQRSDRLTVQQPSPGGDTYTATATLPGATPGQLTGLVDPLPLRLEGSTDRFVDVVVVGTASNSVLVYRGLGRDTYAAPLSYPVGTQPVDVTAADLNRDGVLDLVVTNRGSNDLSLLFGQLDAQGRWVAHMGPRLRSGGIAPLGTTVRTRPDGQQQLIVTNSATTTNSRLGNVAILAGRGLGFFDDRDPQWVAIGTPVGHGIALPVPPTLPNPLSRLWIPGASGDVLGVDLTALRSLGVVYDAGPLRVRSLAALSGGRAVITLEDGRVSLLRSQAGDTLTLQANLVAQEGLPSEPDALQILETGGTLRALVTSLGSEQVYVFDLLTGRQVDLPSIDRARDLTPTAVSLPGSSLAVVVILLAGELTETIEPDEQRASLEELPPTPPVGIRPAAGSDEEPTPSSGGGEDEAPDAALTQVADTQEPAPSAIDAEDELRNRPLPEPTLPRGVGITPEPPPDLALTETPPEEAAPPPSPEADRELPLFLSLMDPISQPGVSLRDLLALLLFLPGSTRSPSRRPSRPRPLRTPTAR